MEAESLNSIGLLDDEPLVVPSSAKLQSWCPTMDLIAIVTVMVFKAQIIQVENTIWVHRQTRQKLFTLRNESPISAISWSTKGLQRSKFKKREKDSNRK